MNMIARLFCVALAAAAGCFPLACESRSAGDPAPTPSGAPPPIPAALRGRIICQSRVEGRWQIVRIDLEKRTRTVLTRSPGDNNHPSFSPGGEWIAFESTRGGGEPAIYRMRADGSGAERLTPGAAPCHSPCWRPDGAAVAYDSPRGDGYEIYGLDIATRREWQITRSLWRSILPHWSPDGSSIAFTRSELGWGIYRMNADGSGVKALATKGGSCRPDWSPDGKRIAYVSHLADGKGDVWTMGPDGADKVRVTLDSASYDYDPAWSPDGKWIVYQSTTDKKRGPWGLYAVPAAGGEPVRLSPDGVDDRFPDWAP
jgi:Tol biopolymer transport system component